MDGWVSVSGGMGSQAQILVDGDISGTVEVAPAGCGNNVVKGVILADADGIGGGSITGPVTIDGEFFGNICADNLAPGEALPDNININFGPSGTVCGAPPCFVPVAPPAPDPNWLDAGFGTKNRYIAFVPGNPGLQTALRVTLANSNPALQWWVGPPFQVCENSGQNETDYPACGPSGPQPLWFWAAELKCDPFFRVWDGSCSGGFCAGGLNDGAACTDNDDCAQVVHVLSQREGAQSSVQRIVPDRTYDVQAVHEDCDLGEESNFSAPLAIRTTKWGDICGPGPGGACTGVANGTVDVTNDVLGLLDKFENINALPKSSGDVAPDDVDLKINIIFDVSRVLDAFQGFPYPFGTPEACGTGGGGGGLPGS